MQKVTLTEAQLVGSEVKKNIGECVRRERERVREREQQACC